MAGQLIVECKQYPQRALHFRALHTAAERLRGLLGTRATADPVALIGCDSIHTFGMRYRLDVAMLGPGGVVLAAWKSVPPGQILKSERAWVTLERPHSRLPWFARGELVYMHWTHHKQEQRKNMHLMRRLMPVQRKEER